MAAWHWEARLGNEDAANNFPVIIPSHSGWTMRIDVLRSHMVSCRATALSTKFTSAEEHMACKEFGSMMIYVQHPNVGVSENAGFTLRYGALGAIAFPTIMEQTSDPI